MSLKQRMQHYVRDLPNQKRVESVIDNSIRLLVREDRVSWLLRHYKRSVLQTQVSKSIALTASQHRWIQTYDTDYPSQDPVRIARSALKLSAIELHKDFIEQAIPPVIDIIYDTQSSDDLLKQFAEIEANYRHQLEKNIAVPSEEEGEAMRHPDRPLETFTQDWVKQHFNKARSRFAASSDMEP